MSSQSRVLEVLEEMLESKCTPEQACVNCPELLPIVRERWSQMRAVEAKLDSIFPESNPGVTKNDQWTVRPWKDRPEIPGYLVSEVLGRGGVGVVYKARHLKLNRVIALKMLLSGAYASSTELKRFMREAESIASLRHPNLVQVFDVGDLDGCPYFTMEFVEGGNLAQKLAGVPMPNRQAVALLSTIAQAMHAAHCGAIVHRDLKPSNILLTSDGTPKISDFGLARRFDSQSDLTIIGDRVGTPCYMAPEQAKGAIESAGPPADIYSLGAILYELLTGRPPFQGETPGDTERLLMFADPVPPSRLNPKVPRDLETICLKCLQKDPQRRYTTAAVLAADLQRFARGETILARPAGVAERVGKWIRRRPAQAGAVIGIGVLSIALVGDSLWILAQHSATARALADDLQEVTDYENKADWNDARMAQQRANARLTADMPEALCRRASQNDLDLALVEKLNSIQMNRMNRILVESGTASSAADYAAAFRDAGLGTPEQSPDEVAAKVKASNIRLRLVDALNSWSYCTQDSSLQQWLDDVTVLADPSPNAWIKQVRECRNWNDKDTLNQLLQTSPTDQECLSLATSIALKLQTLGGNSIPFLKQLLRAHPTDFWLNFALGEAYRSAGQPLEAARFYQAAAVLCPDTTEIYIALGDSLYDAAQFDDALEAYRTAAAIFPNAYVTQADLGIVLCDMHQYPESVVAFSRAVKLNPSATSAIRAKYAISLDGVGNLDEALRQYAIAIALDYKVMSWTNKLRQHLIRTGQAEGVQLAWKRAIDLNPPDHIAYDGYAELCLFLGNTDEYRRTRNRLLATFGSTTDPHVAERTGRSCLLLPADKDQALLASQLISRALHSDMSKVEPWAPIYFDFAKALSDYRQQQYGAAIFILNEQVRGILGPSPGLLTAMSQYRLGNIAGALKSFQEAVVSYNWSHSHADMKDIWMYHILRREAEQMMLPYLAGFSQGNYKPATNEQRL